MPIEVGTRTRLPDAALEPEHALIAALLRQALADRHVHDTAVRHEAHAWFARGQHRFWLALAGLPEEALDEALQEDTP